MTFIINLFYIFNSFSFTDKNLKRLRCDESEWNPRAKRVRTIFTQEQLERLEQEFDRQQYMVGSERLYLAAELNLSESQVRKISFIGYIGRQAEFVSFHFIW